jgi:hypothetical protein
MITLNDFIVLGRTVPEESNKYGIRVCMAGISATHGFRRIYPLTVDNPLRSRHQASLLVFQNPHDTRRESLKLCDAVDSILSVSAQPVISTEQVCQLAETTGYLSLRAMNAHRVSLGFLRSLIPPQLQWKLRKECTTPQQLSLFDETINDLRIAGFLTGKDYSRVPYLYFRDQERAEHRLQLREWGCFEYLRKWDGTQENLAERLGLLDASREFFLLVGNMSHRRNVWLIIQLFSRRPQGQMALLPFGTEWSSPTQESALPSTYPLVS